MRTGIPFDRLPVVSVDAITRLRKVGPGTVGDALSQLGIRSVQLTTAMRPVYCPGNICGQAVTLKQMPSRGRKAAENHHIHILYSASPGQIVVIDSGMPDLIMMGGRGVLVGKQRGLEGLVLNAAVRDLDEIEATGLPVFATGISVSSPRPRAVVETEGINVPVSFLGCRIDPGDVLVAGRDGVVVVPVDAVTEVLNLAEELDRSDKEQLEKIAKGLPMADWYK
jgi:4-hydroxy-4-methyl-2-oxoglutarate aldolase